MEVKTCSDKFLISILLNVFWALPIFTQASGIIPLVLESTGAIELQQIQRTPDQNIVLAGTFTNTLIYQEELLVSKGEEDVFIMSVDPEGQLLWIKAFGGIFDDDISQLKVEGERIWLAGGFRDRAFFDTLDLSSPDGSRSLFLLQLGQNGDLLTHKQFDGLGLKSIAGIAGSGNGEIYLGGYFRGQLAFDDLSLEATGITDLMVLKLDRKGDFSVLLQAGQKGNTRIEDLLLDDQNNIVIGGTFDDQLILENDTFQANTLDKDVFLASLDTTGGLGWSLKAGGVFDKELVRLALDSEGNIYGAGQLVGVMRFSDELTIQSQNGNSDIYWFKLANNGQPLLASSLGGTEAEVLTDLLIDGNAMWLCGNFQGSFPLNEIQLEAGLNVSSYLIEIDKDQGMIRGAESISASVAVFLYKLLAWQQESVLAAGSFGGLLNIGAEKLDAGPHFWGILTASGGLSTSIQEQPLLNIQLFPNPFVDQIYIDEPQNLDQLWVFDQMGRLRWHTNEPLGLLSLSFLEKGSYQILMKGKKGNFSSQWIIKQ